MDTDESQMAHRLLQQDPSDWIPQTRTSDWPYFYLFIAADFHPGITPSPESCCLSVVYGNLFTSVAGVIEVQ